MGGITPARWVAAMAKPYNMPVIPHGASVYNYHYVMANTNSPYAEYLSVGKGDAIQFKSPGWTNGWQKAVIVPSLKATNTHSLFFLFIQEKAL